MAIYFETSNPAALLKAFKSAISEGHVKTWSCDTQGDFTHTPEQWRNRAWLRPRIDSGRLTMLFLGRNDENTTWPVYSVYHGRFVESLVEHCHDLFNEARTPSKPTVGDNITAKAA